MHPNNIHSQGYDFEKLVKAIPELEEFTHLSKSGRTSIDFSNQQAVRLLNKGLLNVHYGIKHWDIPPDFLCPSVPGRADYIHQLNDLIGKTKDEVNVLDIGTGSSLIYPLLGWKIYGWNFLASDISKHALKVAKVILQFQKGADTHIGIRLQTDKQRLFAGMIGDDEYFHATMCNPPFHRSAADAQRANNRKNINLGLETKKLNFGGTMNELWYEGGERNFITKMIKESRDFRNNVGWFTTLVSKKENIAPLIKQLERKRPSQIETIEMALGNKKSRILAWSYLH